MTINTGDVIRTTVDMRFDVASVQQNVFHTQYTGDPISSDLIGVNAIKVKLEAGLYSVINFDVSDLLVFVAYINFNVTQGVPMPDSIPVTVLDGAHAGETLPAQVAGLMSFPTAVARSIGRKYIGAYTENATDGKGIVGVSELIRLITASANLIGGFSMSTGTGVFGNYIPLTSTFHVWTAARVDLLFRTQRRRVPGVGI